MRSAAPVTQNHFSKPEDLMLQNATPLRKSVPGPPNSSDEHVSCTAAAMENASLQILFKCPTPAIHPFCKCYKTLTFCSLLTRCTIPCACHAKRHLNVKKCSEPFSFFALLTSKCASRYKRRALFRHLSYQKWSEPGMFCTFWLRNVLRATTTCTFSTSQLPKVVGTWCVLYILLEMCFAPQQRALFRHLNFQKWSDTGVFCTFCLRNGKSEQNVRVGAFEEDLQRCIFRGRRSTRDMFIRDVRRWGRWFPERGCILEHQIFSFGKMILHDRCSTSYDLASLFRGRRSTLDRWSGKIAKRPGTRPSALHSTFRFWRKSRRIVSFLMLSTPKIEEVSQNCFVFDVVNSENWGSLAELLCFWCCQVQNWGSLAELPRFWSVAKELRFQACRSTDRQTETDRDRQRQTETERETERQTDRQTGRQAGRQRDREIER